MGTRAELLAERPMLDIAAMNKQRRADEEMMGKELATYKAVAARLSTQGRLPVAREEGGGVNKRNGNNNLAIIQNMGRE